MTLTENAYVALRHDIVRGLHAPGQPLRMEDLRKRYDMGFSPLREALSRLQSEGLVHLAPLRGFTVATLSLSEMWETVDLRILIENEALRLSIANGDDAWESGIVASLHALVLQSERKPAADDPALWELEDRHHKFHRQIVSACGSARMLTFFERLYVETERYRMPVLLRSAMPSGRNIQAEHSEIAEAALARRSDKAVKLLTRHYKLTAEAIQAIVKEQANNRAGTSTTKKGAGRNKYGGASMGSLPISTK
jgi:DNA-binding GntR family transcriptional regulator